MQQRSYPVLAHPRLLSLQTVSTQRHIWTPLQSTFSPHAPFCLRWRLTDGPCLCISIGIESCLLVCLCQRLRLCLVAFRKKKLPSPLPFNPFILHFSLAVSLFYLLFSFSISRAQGCVDCDWHYQTSARVSCWLASKLSCRANVCQESRG